MRGRLLEEQGQSVEALGEFYRGLLLDDRAPSFPRRVSELSARLGDSERSLEFALRAVTLDSTDARSQWLRGTALLNLGRDQEALEALTRATRHDTTEAEYFRALARVAERLDRVELVAQSSRNVVMLEDDDAEAWFQLAAADARMGRFAQAETELAEAVERNPIRPGIFFLQGWIQESLGRPARAADLYRQHLDIHRDDQTARRRLVNVLAQENRYREAYEHARVLAKERPDDLETRAGEVELAFRLGRRKEANALLERWRLERPHDPEVTAQALTVMARRGDAARASREVEAWARSQPEDHGRWLVAGRVHGIAKQPERALAAFGRAIELAPDSLAPRVMLARFHQEAKRMAEAERAWLAAIEQFPDVGALRLDLALCREQQGDIPGAEAAVRDALEREPDNPVALNFLGYLLADHNRKLDEAVDLIRRALVHDPRNGAYLDSLGWAFYRLGRLEEARTHLEQAVALTGHPEVHEHLGDVYKDLRLLELANDQYRKSWAADSTNERVRDKLEGSR
ncbi:MAG TPA: tetratricopeptide repeat protein [Candidatus Limnocylindria bacterium]|nr:tetratricopeptide repeat protein [Candidatus Limnocylindria bacterium]